MGEIRYVFGHLFGSADCSLCDITHSPVRRKPEWDRMVARLGRPIVLLHRNELDGALDAAVRGIALPVVVARASRIALTSLGKMTTSPEAEPFHHRLRCAPGGRTVRPDGFPVRG